jgi:hypothetical protein
VRARGLSHLTSKHVLPIEPLHPRHHIEVSIPAQQWKTVLAAQGRNPKVIRWNRLSSLSQFDADSCIMMGSLFVNRRALCSQAPDHPTTADTEPYSAIPKRYSPITTTGSANCWAPANTRVTPGCFSAAAASSFVSRINHSSPKPTFRNQPLQTSLRSSC